MQRRKEQLKEDKEMLNIALDSKQQELELVSVLSTCLETLSVKSQHRASLGILLSLHMAINVEVVLTRRSNANSLSRA